MLCSSNHQTRPGVSATQGSSYCSLFRFRKHQFVYGPVQMEESSKGSTQLQEPSTPASLTEFQSETRLQRQSTQQPLTNGPAPNVQLLRKLSITRDLNGSLSVDLDRVDGLKTDESMRPLARVPSNLRRSEATMRVCSITRLTVTSA